MPCTGAAHIYTLNATRCMQKINMVHIRPQYWAGSFRALPMPIFRSFCFYFVVKETVFWLELHVGFARNSSNGILCTTRISWKVIKEKWQGIRDSEGQNRAQNISIAILEKQKGKYATCELVEQIQWGKIRTGGLYWWQWKNNWNSNRV